MSRVRDPPSQEPRGRRPRGAPSGRQRWVLLTYALKPPHLCAESAGKVAEIRPCESSAARLGRGSGNALRMVEGRQTLPSRAPRSRWTTGRVSSLLCPQPVEPRSEGRRCGNRPRKPRVPPLLRPLALLPLSFRGKRMGDGWEWVKGRAPRHSVDGSAHSAPASPSPTPSRSSGTPIPFPPSPA